MKLKLIMNDSPKYPECKTLLVDMEDLNLNLKNKFVVNNKILDLKSEFHITLVGNDDALLLKNKFIEISNKDDLDSEYSNLYDEIQELVNNSKISFVEHVFSNAFRRSSNQLIFPLSTIKSVETFSANEVSVSNVLA